MTDSSQNRLLVDHHRVKIGDLDIHYVTAGDRTNDPVVLLHGWPQTWFVWRRMIPLLTEEYFVVAPDLPGLGESAYPLPDYTKRSIADRLWGLLHNELDLPPFHLVGHDWGGPVAFHIAAAHEETVKTLAILDVAVPGDGRATGAMSVGVKWHIAFNMVPDLPEILTEGRERPYLTWYFNHYCTTPGAVDDAIESYIEAYTRPGAMRSGLALYKAIGKDAVQTAALREKGKIGVPVLAIGGGESRGAEVGESMGQLAEQVKSEAFPGCGHFVPEERPDETVGLLRKFFTGV